MTPTPLVEEYASARLVWGLTMVDLCEIAHNSVHISSLPAAQKAAIGSKAIEVSNVPPVRWAFRQHTFELNQRVLRIKAAGQAQGRIGGTTFSV